MITKYVGPKKWHLSMRVLSFLVEANSGEVLECWISENTMIDIWGVKRPAVGLTRDQATALLEKHIVEVLSVVDYKLHARWPAGQIMAIKTGDF